jgi:hypothetical protein
LERDAVQFCHDYALSHSLFFHALFAPGTQLGTVSSVSFDPSKGKVTFKLVLNGVACEMDIAPSLELGIFRSVPGWHDTDEGMDQFGIAFDTCLAYIEANCDEIQGLGFDVSEFRRQRAAIQGDTSPP